MKYLATLATLATLTFSLSSFAGARLLCNPEHILEAIDNVFEKTPSPFGADNRHQIGRNSISQSVKVEFAVPTTEDYIKTLVSNKEIENNAQIDCDDIALKWVDKNKDGIIAKYSVAYNPEILKSMIARKDFLGKYANCVVLSDEESKVEKMCDGQRSPNSLIKVCTKRYVCPDLFKDEVSEEIHTAVCSTGDVDSDCEKLSIEQCVDDPTVKDINVKDNYTTTIPKNIKSTSKAE